MKTLLLLLLAIFCFFIPAHAQEKPAAVDSATVNKTAIERDGSSFEKAIFIQEVHESPGIHAEYAWILKKYPGYKTRGQSLSYNKNKPYDIIHITTADDKAMDIYFDISNFYGKF